MFVPQPLSDVIHKVVINVDELGTEAAAVTVGLMEKCAISRSNPFEMIVNRPFLFMVRSSVQIYFAADVKTV